METAPADKLSVELDRQGEAADTPPPLRFRSDLRIDLLPNLCCGDDAEMARAAWGNPPYAPRPDESPKTFDRVLGACVPFRHTSPIEHGLMGVWAEAPMVAWFQWVRHRFMSMDVEDFCFSLQSGRYRLLDGTFYVPDASRPAFEPPGFKPMRPCLVTAKQYLADKEPAPPAPDAGGDEYEYGCWHERVKGLESLVDVEHRSTSRIAYESFQKMISAGVAREVARNVLGVNHYYGGRITARPSTWLHFFSLRIDDRANRYETKPQWEIEVLARKCEDLFKARWPLTHAQWVKAGRCL